MVAAEKGETEYMTRALIAAAAAALAVAGAARAEMPQNTSAPELTGRAAVGWGLVGHNGTWLYLDGSACGSECTYSFAWERCSATGCRAVAGATNRVYKVRSIDAGFRLRVLVTTSKHDCGEWNYAAGTRECRVVTRVAASVQSAAVPKTVRAHRAKKPRRARR